MQGNNIGDAGFRGQAVLFEGVLARPAGTVLSKFYKQRGNWDRYINSYLPNELSIKAMIDSSVRLGIATDVYTLIDENAVPVIDRWLLKKGISVSVNHYSTLEELAYDLRFQHSIRTIYVETAEQASTIGIRSHVVDPKKAWIS